MNNIIDLIECAKSYKKVYIQPHNFPDHDALGAAFGFKNLLHAFGVDSQIVYGGDISRASIVNMVKKFDMRPLKISAIEDSEDEAVIMIDGCRGNKNMQNLLKAKLIGVIDHHDTSHIKGIPHIDIRPAYGSCSTIIFTYFEFLDVEISRDVATALMIGLCVDTAILMRNIVENDARAYFQLFSKADNAFVQCMVRNYIETKDLIHYKYAIENVIIESEIAFCYLKNGCSQNLLGIMADFFLALEEVTFVLLCARNDGKIMFSLRSENEKWNAADIIQTLLNGKGFGGGHYNMAGGVMIERVDNFDCRAFFLELKGLLSAAAPGAAEASHER
jgi:nanoRNase/pAp phosphatase (c-di-AMP/oligoRNAs hydrolase)